MSIENSNLKSNSNSLQEILETINNLPEASSGGGTDTSDATAVASDIMLNKTAYTADGKTTGSFTIDNELTEQNDLISQISTLVNQKANPQGGTDTSDATATASDILSGKTAYVDGEKITGNIATKTSSDLTASGATVTVPKGYYASQATKSITNGSAKTPATTVTKNPTISVSTSGLITASVSGTQSITPTVTAGYVSSGTSGTITVSGSATKQLTTKAATTYTPSTTDQTISSGTYLTGTQTIKGDSNLVAGNIKSGISIFGVNGTYEGSSSGGGGTGEVETVTFSILEDGPADIWSGRFWYVNKDGQLIQSDIVNAGKSIQVAKNSIITIQQGNPTIYGDVTGLTTMYGNTISYFVTGDFYVYANA